MLVDKWRTISKNKDCAILALNAASPNRVYQFIMRERLVSNEETRLFILARIIIRLTQRFPSSQFSMDLRFQQLGRNRAAEIIIRALVEGNNGNISMRSRESEGSQFTVRSPIPAANK